MEFSLPDINANASLLSKVFTCKHYIPMYLNEYQKKLWLSVGGGGGELVTENTPPPKSECEYHFSGR